MNLTEAWGATAGISVGAQHICVRDIDGIAKCLGANYFGELGDGTTNSTAVPVPVQVAGTAPTGAGGGATGPTAGALGNSLSVRQIVTGAHHSCMLLDDGAVDCWGLNDERQLGDVTRRALFAATPRSVPGLVDGVTQLATRSNHTCAIVPTGRVVCWGANPYGQLGNHKSGPYDGVSEVSGLTGAAVQLTTGREHSCAVVAGGAVECWGLNDSGQLGTGTWISSMTAVKVVGLPAPASEVSAGAFHTCAVLIDRRHYCWGQNDKGQLGSGDHSDSNRPLQVRRVGGVHFEQVALVRGEVSTAGSARAWSDLQAKVVAIPPREGSARRQCKMNAHLSVKVAQGRESTTRQLVKRFSRLGATRCVARFSFSRITDSSAAATVTLRGSYKGNKWMPATSYTEVFNLP